MTTVPRSVRRTAAGLAAALALAGGAMAAGGPTSAHAAPAVSGHRLDRLDRLAAISAYWTPARMRAATPVDSPTTTARSSARTTGLTSNTQPTNTGGVGTPRTVGKLFFTDSGTDYVCSAAAIATTSRNQVLTAGHCVHTGPHPDGGLLGLGLLDIGLLDAAPHYYSHWIYVPRYTNGTAPYGKWVATHAFVARGWTQDESFRQDQAILTVARLHGRRLVDVTGGNRVVLGTGPAHAGVRIWGWPEAAPYDGETAWRCDGNAYASPDSSPGDSAMTCGLNGGASGGPWLLPRNRTANVGTIYAVTSRITTAGPHVILAEPLPTSLRTLIVRAGG